MIIYRKQIVKVYLSSKVKDILLFGNGQTIIEISRLCGFTSYVLKQPEKEFWLE